MNIPDEAFILLGLVMAHSAYSIHDQDGELCPYVLADIGETREIIPFEEETQQAAVDNAVAQFGFLKEAYDRWAFAKEGSASSGGRRIDVLIVESWCKGMDDTVALIQEFTPFSSGEFRVIGAPEILIGGVPVNGSERERILELVEDGIDSHPEIEDFWTTYGGLVTT